MEFTFSNNRRWLAREEIEEMPDESDELLKIHHEMGLAFISCVCMFDKVVIAKSVTCKGN